MQIIPVVVAFHSPRWLRVAVNSYLRQWPEETILVVDNDGRPGDDELGIEITATRRWLAGHRGVTTLDGGTDRSHGAGMDRALAWCRAQKADVMLCFEPDCLVTGKRWRELLADALEQGAEMAGTHRYAFGPIHPCPSVWRTDVDWPSFTTQLRGADESHPRFLDVYDLPLRLETARKAGERKFAFWSRYWDATQKAWFHAAVRDKAPLIAKADAQGFKHYWRGSSENRNHSQLTGLLAEYSAA